MNWSFLYLIILHSSVGPRSIHFIVLKQCKHSMCTDWFGKWCLVPAILHIQVELVIARFITLNHYQKRNNKLYKLNYVCFISSVNLQFYFSLYWKKKEPTWWWKGIYKMLETTDGDLFHLDQRSESSGLFFLLRGYGQKVWPRM